MYAWTDAGPPEEQRRIGRHPSERRTALAACMRCGAGGATSGGDDWPGPLGGALHHVRSAPVGDGTVCPSPVSFLSAGNGRSALPPSTLQQEVPGRRRPLPASSCLTVTAKVVQHTRSTGHHDRPG